MRKTFLIFIIGVMGIMITLIWAKIKNPKKPERKFVNAAAETK